MSKRFLTPKFPERQFVLNELFDVQVSELTFLLWMMIYNECIHKLK